jgi:hypothetical protein
MTMVARRLVRLVPFVAALGTMLLPPCALGDTSSGTINATLINVSGIALVFDTDPSGIALSNNGSSAASANFGTISAFGPLSAGVTRPSVGPATYVVQTFFDVNVIEGGLLLSPNYTLKAQLAAAAPTGFTYGIDAVTLTTSAQTIQANGPYNTDVQHTLKLTVSTAAPGAGGPGVGSPLTSTIDFTATSN